MSELTHKIITIINEMKAKAEAKREIWVTEYVPHKDAENETVIIQMDVAKTAKACRILQYAPLRLMETVTGADVVLLMHPATYAEIKPACRGIPAYGDDTRISIFKNRGERETPKTAGG